MSAALDRLEALGLALPAPPTPRGSYRAWRRSGALLVTAGVLPMDGDRLLTGRVGDDLTVAEGALAARTAALSLLAVLAQGAGELDRITQVVLLQGWVRSAPGFTAQPQVIDGASDLLVAVLGEAGRHARVALGAAELPLGAVCELQATAEVADG